MTAASGMSRDELDRHVALASTDDFLVLDGSVVLRDGATDDALLDALHARARTLRVGNEGLREARSGREKLRTALRDAGWSTQSFMFPEVQIRADWGETSKS